MYLYIYDQSVQDRKHERDMAAIENRLTDLGIAGKVIRMALFRHAGENIRDEARRGASTVVVVGNDRTVAHVLDAVVEADLPLGVIPVGPDNQFAQMLGIPSGVEACDVLSARIIERVDTGRVNGKRFVTGVRVSHPDAKLICEGQYSVSAASGGLIEIRNFTPINGVVEDLADPCDGFFEARIRVPRREGWFKKSIGSTTLPIRFGTIEAPREFDAICDGQALRGKKFEISIEPLNLKVITGRERMF